MPRMHDLPGGAVGAEAGQGTPSTDGQMTDAQFKVVREFLGLTGDWIAEWLGVSPRTVRHWEQGKYPIPDGVRALIESLEARTSSWVTEIAAELTGVPDPTVVTYRTDVEYHADHPDAEFPASWHRAVIARVALKVPALAIVFADP